MRLARTLSACTILTCVLAAAACSRPPADRAVAFAGSARPTEIGLVSYCPRSGSVAPSETAFYYDTSGSMAGYAASAPHVESWVEHAVSLSGNGAPTKLVFSTTRGISPTSSLSSVQPRGDTNLDEAISDAARRSLAIIVTDGVAAAGSGSGDCAGGVDPACFARALQRAVHPSDDGAAATDRGIWVVPLVVEFDGTLFTEQVVPASAFSAADAISAIQLDTGRTVAIQGAANDPAGRLMYQYKGPRVLLALVTAEPAERGRDLVAALMETARSQGFALTEDLRSTSAVAGIFRPIELYPGYLPAMTFSEAVENYDSSTANAIDMHFDPMGPSMVLTCPPGDSERAVYDVLSPEWGTETGSGCVQLALPMPFRLSLAPSTGDRAAFDQIVQDTRWDVDKGGGGRISILAQCDGNASATTRVAASAVAFPLYKDAADAMAAESADSAAQHTLGIISTMDPKSAPHRSYGVGKAIELFYRDIAGDQRRIPIGRLAIETRPFAGDSNDRD